MRKACFVLKIQAFEIWSIRKLVTYSTRTVMRNDSTGQFEGGECLEGASSLSAARFEGTGLLQHGSYAIGCRPLSVKPEKTALF